MPWVLPFDEPVVLDRHYRLLRRSAYIKGVVEEAPSVITLNMRAASAMVNEYLARAYPFRQEPNGRYARTSFSLAACEEDYTAESEFPAEPSDVLGRGDAEPLLGLLAFRLPKKVAA